MDLAQLRNFIQVAELGSLSSAADHLMMSQSALSRQIGALEDELGVRLFVRHRRGMVTTEQGRNILRRATAIVTALDELRASTRSSGSPLSGHVAIGLPSALAGALSVPLDPRPRGFDGLGMAETGQVFRGDQHLDTSRHSGLTADQAGAFQGQDHLVHGRRTDLEMALHVGLSRGTAMDAGVSVDEGQVLALPVSEALSGHSPHARFIG